MINLKVRRSRRSWDILRCICLDGAWKATKYFIQESRPSKKNSVNTGTSECESEVPILPQLRLVSHRQYFWRPMFFTAATAVAQWLRCCATNRKVAGSIPAGVTGIFH